MKALTEKWKQDRTEDRYPGMEHKLWIEWDEMA